MPASFNSRLNVTVDFYNDITKDLILRMDLPQIQDMNISIRM